MINIDDLDIFDDCNELLTRRARSTELSRFSEHVMYLFLRSNHTQVRVKRECTKYDTETLYGGLRRVAKKKSFRANKIAVHKQDNEIYLIKRSNKGLHG